MFYGPAFAKVLPMADIAILSKGSANWSVQAAELLNQSPQNPHASAEACTSDLPPPLIANT